LDSLFLGIDLGTTAVKALVADGSGRQASLGGADCRVSQPGPSRQEMAAEEVWESMAAAVSAALRGVDANGIKAIAFSAAMHGMMAVDKNGRPLTRMLTWADGRAREQAETLARDHDGSAIFNRTGCPPTALYYPAKIKWLKDSDPDAFEKADKFVSIKDFIFHRLSGRWVCDRSHASSNGLLDIRSLEWDRPLLNALGLSADQLPELVDSDSAAGALEKARARELGLNPGIPLVPGAGDGGLANLGAGAVDPGQAACTVGASGAMRKVLSEPWLDPEEKIWCYHLAPGRWYAGGAINSGGIVLRWLRDGLLSETRDRATAEGGEPYRRIIEMAEQVRPGAEGLVFLPYLHGERTPYWNPLARGVLFGLDPRHGKEHLARAALEGVCMAMAHVHELIKDSPGGITEIRATGGFTRSEFWVKLMADVLGQTVSLPAATESSAMGAAILAMKATGAIRDLSEAKQMIPVDRELEPDLKKTKIYSERFELFKDLYEHLESDFEKLGRLTE
jgi:gluconokinase